MTTALHTVIDTEIRWGSTPTPLQTKAAWLDSEVARIDGAMERHDSSLVDALEELADVARSVIALMRERRRRRRDGDGIERGDLEQRYEDAQRRQHAAPQVRVHDARYRVCTLYARCACMRGMCACACMRVLIGTASLSLSLSRL